LSDCTIGPTVSIWSSSTGYGQIKGAIVTAKASNIGHQDVHGWSANIIDRSRDGFGATIGIANRNRVGARSNIVTIFSGNTATPVVGVWSSATRSSQVDCTI
jgi:hypothetical protein